MFNSTLTLYIFMPFTTDKKCNNTVYVFTLDTPWRWLINSSPKHVGVFLHSRISAICWWCTCLYISYVYVFHNHPRILAEHTYPCYIHRLKSVIRSFPPLGKKSRMWRQRPSVYLQPSINDKTVCTVFTYVGISIIYKKFSRKPEFHENPLSYGHALSKGVKEFRPVVSTFLGRFWCNSL